MFVYQSSRTRRTGTSLLALLSGGQCDTSVPFRTVGARSRPQAAVSSGVFRRGRTARPLDGTARPGTRAYQFLCHREPDRDALFPITMSFGAYGFGELHDPAGTLGSQVRAASFVRSKVCMGVDR